MVIRLGPVEPVTVATSECLAALCRIDRLYAEEARLFEDEDEEDAFWESFENLRNEFAVQADQYFEEARKIAGSRLVVPG